MKAALQLGGEALPWTAPSYETGAAHPWGHLEKQRQFVRVAELSFVVIFFQIMALTAAPILTWIWLRKKTDDWRPLLQLVKLLKTWEWHLSSFFFDKCFLNDDIIFDFFEFRVPWTDHFSEQAVLSFQKRTNKAWGEKDKS